MRWLLSLALSTIFCLADIEAAQAQSPPAKAKRVVVLHLPDRPASYWRDGVPLRVNNTIFPIEDSTQLLPLPGFDWSKAVLDAVVQVMRETYPELTFIPVEGIAQERAPDTFEGPPKGMATQAEYRAFLKEQMRLNDAATFLIVSDRGIGDGSRPPGGLGLYARGLSDGEATRRFSRFRVYGYWSAVIYTADEDFRSEVGAFIGAMTLENRNVQGELRYPDLLPKFEGTVSEISAAANGTRREELIRALTALPARGLRDSMPYWKSQLELVHDRAPYWWKLPYFPPAAPRR